MIRPDVKLFVATRRRRFVTIRERAIRAVGLAALILAAGCGSSTGSVTQRGATSARSHPGPVAAAPAAIANPAILAVVQAQNLQIRSATTGRLDRTLTHQVGSVSLSPDGTSVYYETSGGPLDPFPIDRVSTTGATPRRVATGEDPAVSPNGADLAYATGNGQGVEIEHLATGRTRTIALAP